MTGDEAPPAGRERSTRTGDSVSATDGDTSPTVRVDAARIGAAEPAPFRADGAALREGSLVGRYVVVERLGEGGMGVVARAYDPKLRREVALKVMRAQTSIGRREAEARMLREAQALARLSHPHVVAVYDAEPTDQGVCIAMEYVEGETLRAWLKQASRTWGEVLDVGLSMARGLAAAHAAGVVHRDVKPANVLVGTDGRVRLTDFGLARERPGALGSTNPRAVVHHEPGGESSSSGESSSREPSSGEPSSHDTGGLAELTEVGTVLGTPSYMAPEQHAGEPADARSDQYALCVVLWEALHGRRPFEGRDDALAEAKRRGPPERPRGPVPKWLHDVVTRGLAVSPATRWPSMDALANALASGQGRARTRRVLGGLALVAALVVVAMLGVRWDRANRAAACEEAGATIFGAWNDGARERLRAALVGTGVSHAEVTANKVMPWLDDYARAWQTARTQACLDTDVHGQWNEDLLGRAQWCLDERRMELEAMLEELSRGEARGVDKAVEAAAGLGRIDHCRDAEVLVRTPTPPAEHREEVRALRAELSRVRALRDTGAYDEGLSAARAALVRAEAVAWPPLAAEARYALGNLLEYTGAYVEAEEALEAAYFEAAEAGAAEVATVAAQKLVFTVGVRLARHTEAFRWSRLAEVTLVSLPDVAQLRKATHLANLAGVHDSTGSYAEAKALHERALAIEERALGPEHPSVATSLNNLALVHRATGSYAEAKALQERALGIRERALGPHHPDVAQSLNNLAGVHYGTGSYAEAKALLERALAIREQVLGPHHPDVAASLNNLAGIHRATGSYAEATALYEQALAIWEQALGPEHPDLATSLNNLANLHQVTGSYAEAKALHERALAIREQTLGSAHPDVAQSLDNLASVHNATGSYAEAKALHERALAIREQTLGPEHPEVAASLNNLAAVHWSTGSYAEAKASYERALAIREQALGSEHPGLAYPLLGLARIALARGRAADAAALAERAVKVREDGSAPAGEVAEARFELARALWVAGGDRAHAGVLAEQARDAYREAGDAKAMELAEVEAWLRARGGAR
jgi:eukaryotic-like serine/threonine-protein kinase